MSAGSAAPIVAAVEMGYGHLRAARPLARALGTEVVLSDRGPIADASEQRQWKRLRDFHRLASLGAHVPLLARATRFLLDSATDIEPLHYDRAPTSVSLSVRLSDWQMRSGMGRGLVEHARALGAPLLATFYTQALAADAAGHEPTFCLVTDTDAHRVWAAMNPATTRIHYFAPTARVQRRLLAYGVPAHRVRLTGFPLPSELVGDDVAIARANLAARLVRLDPLGVFRRRHARLAGELLEHADAEEREGPPLLTFAVGGAGAQLGIVEAFLPSLAPMIRERRLRLCLVAGTHAALAERLVRLCEEHGLDRELDGEVQVVHDSDLEGYFVRFDALMARTDVLWTKPSELVFYAALGLPLVIAPYLGRHEHHNRQWLRDQGLGIKQRDPAHARFWLREWLDDGFLAGAAWSGFCRLPKRGTEKIVAAVREWVHDGSASVRPSPRTHERAR